jgi:hypothetical protein
VKVIFRIPDYLCITDIAGNKDPDNTGDLILRAEKSHGIFFSSIVFLSGPTWAVFE